MNNQFGFQGNPQLQGMNPQMMQMNAMAGFPAPQMPQQIQQRIPQQMPVQMPQQTQQAFSRPAQQPTLSTEQIQQILDQNQDLIFAILENQKLGKFHECEQYQKLLQNNLIQLATIADQQANMSQAYSTDSKQQ